MNDPGEVLAQAIVWRNGVVICLDPSGAPMPVLQGLHHDVRIAVVEAADQDTQFLVATPTGSLRPATRSQWSSWTSASPHRESLQVLRHSTQATRHARPQGPCRH